MVPCYLYFSTDKTSKLSGIIRDTGRYGISHAGIAFYSKEIGGWMVVEAISAGWIIRSYYQFKAQDNEVVCMFAFPEHDLFAGVRRNRDCIGIPYDTTALVGRAVQKWTWAVFRRQFSRNYWNDPAKFYCNEIVAGRVFPCAVPPIDLGLDEKIDMDPWQLAEKVAGSHIATRVADPDAVFAGVPPEA